MSEELQRAIESFCCLIPESKIGNYSPNSNDDRRLKNIYDTAIANNEDISPCDIIICLKKWHPDINEEYIIECGDTAFRYMIDQQ